MADVLVKIALQKLNDVIQDEYGLLVGAKKDVEKLQESFTAIRAAIIDAERRQWKEELVKDWLRKLKDVAYDVDDVLDEWSSSFLRDQGNDNKVSSPLTSPDRSLFQLKLRHRVGRRIKEINERLDQISRDKDRYGFQQVTMEEEVKRETVSLFNEKEIFGREKEKEDVISKLTSESSHAKKDVPMIISIVGMGGMGKTTLAQIVYNDETVENHFALRIWLSVGGDFEVKDLTEKIVESTSSTEYTDRPKDLEVKDHTKKIVEFTSSTEYTRRRKDLGSMQRYLCKLLSTKRFLLVLDDVWNKNSETREQWSLKWEQLSLPLRKGAQGSRIVVTTRDHGVSRMMGTDTANTIDLKALSDDVCWQVFSYKAFSGRTDDECSELDEIGRKINRKCKGLPLAAKTIGSVMRFKRRKEDWVSMSESEMWDAQAGHLPAALLISYDNLPSHLKPCFLYCSLFRQDEEIVKIDLIRLWMAQGYIMAQRGKDIEDIGGEYFDDLIDRSLFQDVEKDSHENIIHCKMHDLVHDLVRHISKEEYFVPGQLLEIPKKARHLSCDSVGEVNSIPDHLYKARNLRTLLSFSLETRTIPRQLFNHLTCLRTLDLSGSGIETLPSSIKHLKHLRYLDLSWCTSLRKLPKQVSSLYNLQTLKLNCCHDLCKLPKGLTRMVSLQHLEIEDTWQLKCTPKGIGGMRSLRVLSRFIVGTEHGYSNIGELKSLNNLHGKLEISLLERVASEDEAKSAELAEKLHLKSLTLLCASMEGNEKIEAVFESLKPCHENLQRLEIDGYCGSKIPSWIQEISSFTKLSEVRFLDCRNFKQLPCLGKLPFLKYLEIYSNMEIERVGREFIGDAETAFPKLEKLRFCDMYKWTEWEMKSLENEQQSIMPCLRHLIISYCSKLKSWPELGKLPSLESLSVDGNEVVEGVGHELYGHCDGGDDAKEIAFPKLKELYFENMSKWEDWELSMENVQIIMPSLLSLTIIDCPKLKSLPECLLAGLKKLTISFCEECTLDGCKGSLLTSSLKCLENLEELVIRGIKSLPHDGWERLESLHTLHISTFPPLTTLPTLPDKLGQLKSLQTLEINDCLLLEYLPTGLGQFKSLQVLSIKLCGQLKSLPDEIGQLKSLHTLEIHDCWRLESLPRSIGQLKSLQKLSITSCDQLRSFPDELTQLQSLNILRISDCSQLRMVLCHQHKHFSHWMPSSSAASKMGGGEDWHKVKHIPIITIDGKIIQSENDG